MTHEDIVYDRRVRLIEYAAKIGNVSEACRVFGVSRKTYYEWINKAEQYGLKPGDVRRAASTLISGEEVGDIFHEGRIYGVWIWSTPETRESLDDISARRS